VKEFNALKSSLESSRKQVAYALKTKNFAYLKANPSKLIFAYMANKLNAAGL